MKTSYKNHKKQLQLYVTNLLNTYFKDGKNIKKEQINKSFDQSYESYILFFEIQNKYYFDKKKKSLNLNHFQIKWLLFCISFLILVIK